MKQRSTCSLQASAAQPPILRWKENEEL